MTLEQATLAALEAAEAGDLEALGRALASRQAALDAADSSITPGIHSAGELTAQLLRDQIRDLRLEAARLQHMAEGFRLDTPPSVLVDFVG